MKKNKIGLILKIIKNKMIIINFNHIKLVSLYFLYWGLRIGDWGLRIGPNPQSPIPNPQSPMDITIIVF
jgi:hypothetical protein